jgi:hypothetical protein
MYGVEYAAVRDGLPVWPPRGLFTTLAEQSGFTERQCRLAAETGRLASIIACQTRSRPGGITGAVALLQLQARRASWDD